MHEELSKYEKYLKSLTPENGVVLDVFDNGFIFNPDKNNIEISVDPTEEYHYLYISHYHPERYFTKSYCMHIRTLSKIRELISDDVNYKKIFKNRQKTDGTSKSIYLKFLPLSKDVLRKTFYREFEKPRIQPTINVFFTSKVRIDLAEGLFNFIYADFETPLKFLLDTYETVSDDSIFSPNPHTVYNTVKRKDVLIFDYHKTVALLKPLLYASIYSGVCPPRFDFNKDFIEQLKWYGEYLINLQNEYREKIQFCFDKEYYPELFFCAEPAARMRLYERIKGYPSRFERTEEIRPLYSKESDKISLDFIKQSAAYTGSDKEKFDILKNTDVSLGEVFEILVHNYDYVERYKFSRVHEILELEFSKLILSDIEIKKCKRCGKYFSVKGKHRTDYCNRISDGDTRSCREIAATDKYKEKNSENKALKIYNKYYKRYHARLKVNQIKEPDFKDWKLKAVTKRYDCEDGKVTPEEYEAWNEEYFPNRTKK